MGDTGDDYRAMKDYRRDQRDKLGIDCPGCKIERPKAHPTRMMPGQKCKVCGTFRDQKNTFHFKC